MLCYRYMLNIYRCLRANSPKLLKRHVEFLPEKFRKILKFKKHLKNVSYINKSDICTFESQDCHSYRRDGDKSGRMFAFMRLK